MLQSSTLNAPLESVSALDLALQDLADDVELNVPSEYIPGERSTHLIVAAANCSMPETRAPRSVFDLAEHSRFEWIVASRRSRLNDQGALSIQKQVHIQITRDVGLVRCHRLHYIDTQEWQEKEAARRARQVVPRPPKQEFRLRRRKAAEVV